MINQATFDYVELASRLAKRFKSHVSEIKIKIKINEYLTENGIDYTLEDSQWLFNQFITLGIFKKVEHTERLLKVFLSDGGRPPRGDIKYKIHRLSTWKGS